MNKQKKKSKTLVLRTFMFSFSWYTSLVILTKAMSGEIEGSFIENALYGLLFIIVAVTSVICIFKLNQEEYIQSIEREDNE